jgi:hypothetical protein
MRPTDACEIYGILKMTTLSKVLNLRGVLSQRLINTVLTLGLALSATLLALACASLWVGLSQSDGLVRYPTAARLAPTSLKLDTWLRGYISQSSAYQTDDDPMQVLRWYIGHNGLDQSRSGPAFDNCWTLTQVEEQFLIQQNLAVTICAESKSTLIFVSRSLVLR